MALYAWQIAEPQSLVAMRATLPAHASSRARDAPATYPDASPSLVWASNALAPCPPPGLSLNSCRLAGNRLRPQGPQKLFAGHGAPFRKLGPSGFCFPPCTRANPVGMRATRRATGAGRELRRTLWRPSTPGPRRASGSISSAEASRSWRRAGRTAGTSPTSSPATRTTWSSSTARSRRTAAGISRGGRESRGARTACGCLPRRAPGLRGHPDQVRRREYAHRRREPGASLPPPQRTRHALSAGRPWELRLPGALSMQNHALTELPPFGDIRIRVIDVLVRPDLVFVVAEFSHLTVVVEIVSDLLNHVL